MPNRNKSYKHNYRKFVSYPRQPYKQQNPVRTNMAQIRYFWASHWFSKWNTEAQTVPQIAAAIPTDKQDSTSHWGAAAPLAYSGMPPLHPAAARPRPHAFDSCSCHIPERPVDYRNPQRLLIVWTAPVGRNHRFAPRHRFVLPPVPGYYLTSKSRVW